MNPKKQINFYSSVNLNICSTLQINKRTFAVYTLLHQQATGSPDELDPPNEAGLLEDPLLCWPEQYTSSTYSYY